MSSRKQGFWISYSDLTTGLMIVFLLIMVTVVLVLKQQSMDQKESVKEIVEDTKSSIVTRSDLAKELKKAVENINVALNGQYKIHVDDVTAELTLPEEFIRFDSNSSRLDQTSVQNLNIFLPEYLCALHRFQQQDGKEYNEISNVFINGFADTEGDPIWNAPLSTNRSREVVNFTMQMLRCQIENASRYTPQTVSNLIGQNMQKYSCRTFEAPKSDDVEACVASYSEVLRDVELKLKGVGYGDSAHCKVQMKESGVSSCREVNVPDATQRKVTFSVDIVGDDMTDLVSYLVDLGELVGLEESALMELKEINKSIRTECLNNPEQYDGCTSNLLSFAKTHCSSLGPGSKGVCGQVYEQMLVRPDLKREYCQGIKTVPMWCTKEAE